MKKGVARGEGGWHNSRDMSTNESIKGGAGEASARLKMGWLVALALGAGAGVLYWLTRCCAVAPGVPAYRLWGALPGVPNPSILTPLWVMLVRAGRAACADLAAWATAWNVLLGAVSVGIITFVATRVRFKIHDEHDPDEVRRERQARYLAGLVTGLYLMGSLPVWVAATRTLPDALHLALLALAALAFSEYQRAGKVWRLAVFGAVYGVGLAEFPTFWALAPMAVILVVRAMLQRAEFRWRQAMVAAWAALVVLIPLLAVSAWKLMGERALVVQGLTGFWPAVWLLLRKEGGSLIQLSRGVGWLLVMLMTYGPWCILFLLRAKKPAWRYGFWMLLLRLIVLAACLAFCFYEPVWNLFGIGALMVTPSVILAACCGHVAGELWVMGQGREHKSVGVGFLLRTLMGMVGFLLLPAVIAAGVLNYPRAEGSAAVPLAQAATEATEALGDGGVVLSDNLLDAAMAVAASDRNFGSFTILNAANAKAGAYRDYLARFAFPDARSEALLSLGFGPFLQDYVMRDGVLGRFGTLSMDETLRGAGYLVPDGLLSRIRTSPPDEAALRDLLATQKPFWERMAELSERKIDPKNSLYPFKYFITQRASKMANNLGFMLLDADMAAEAEEAFLMTRRIFPNNISALLNLLTLTAEQGRTDEAKAYRAEWDEFVERQGVTQRQLWGLAGAFGYIHNTAMLVEQGMMWAVTGKPKIAEAELRRTVRGAQQAKLNDDLRAFLGQMYLAKGELGEGASYYQQLHAEHPDDPEPIYRLAQLDIQQGNIAAAEEKFAGLEAKGIPPETFRFERALIASAQERTDDAIRLLNDALLDKPDDVRALAVQYVIAEQAGRSDVADRALDGMRRMKNRDFASRLVLAQLLLRRKDWSAARGELEALIRLNRAQPRVWEMLLRVDFAERKREQAEDHVRTLLTLEPLNAFGNLMLASFQRERGQLALAESSYRTALMSERSPATLNDLADLLIRKDGGSHAEARALLDEALAASPDSLVILGTRSELNLLDGRLAEAEADITRILAVAPDEPAALFLSARLALAQGKLQEARAIADTIYSKRDALSPDEKAAFRDFQASIRQTATSD